jgi:hypothetical protein
MESHLMISYRTISFRYTGARIVHMTISTKVECPLLMPELYLPFHLGMAAGRIMFGYSNTRPDVVTESSTNIHIHQANRTRNYTRIRTHRVPSGIGYPVDMFLD